MSLRPSDLPSRCPTCERVRRCAYADGRCNACHERARRGYQPRYTGPCLRGCGRPGRGRSGYCRTCMDWVTRRNRRFRAVLGTELPVETFVLALTLKQGSPAVLAEAHAGLRRLLTGLQTGRLNIFRERRGLLAERRQNANG